MVSWKETSFSPPQRCVHTPEVGIASSCRHCQQRLETWLYFCNCFICISELTAHKVEEFIHIVLYFKENPRYFFPWQLLLCVFVCECLSFSHFQSLCKQLVSKAHLRLRRGLPGGPEDLGQGLYSVCVCSCESLGKLLLFYFLLEW